MVTLYFSSESMPMSEFTMVLVPGVSSIVGKQTFVLSCGRGLITAETLRRVVPVDLLAALEFLS